MVRVCVCVCVLCSRKTPATPSSHPGSWGWREGSVVGVKQGTGQCVCPTACKALNLSETVHSPTSFGDRGGRGEREPRSTLAQDKVLRSEQVSVSCSSSSSWSSLVSPKFSWLGSSSSLS
ncbi:hypothetical protein AMECASPLE_010052 [Ameca splendens]|uniref:Secreted protein n=1 Tax=Ameca splendens TaxID=208324 RepID=A0ABV0YBJ2_9TELE